MKVVAINGSPNAKGNTWHALKIMADELERQGIETEICQVGNLAIRGCVGCRMCRQNGGKCVLPDDGVNELAAKMASADGIVLASPVYFANISGTMKNFLDRVFFSMGSTGAFRHKVGAVVVAVRRTGGLPSVDTLSHYMTYSEMIMPGANYWNVIHGQTPGQVLEDPEGVQDLQVLARNVAWVMKLVEYGKDAVPAPAPTAKIMTNFIR